MRREDLQLVSFRKAVAAQHIEKTVPARCDIGNVHGLLFVTVVSGSLLGLGKVEAGAVGTVGHGQQLVGHRRRRLAVEHAAVSAHDAGHVEGLLVAALDLDGINSRAGQLAQMREHVHVLRVHDEGAAVVLLDGEELAGALLLFQKESRRSFRRRELLKSSGAELIAPAAGLGAVALVARAAGEIAADEAPARDGHAHGAVGEGLYLQIRRRVLTQAGDIGERHLAGAHHPARAEGMPHPSCRRIGHRGLGAHMALHPRSHLAGYGEGAQIADDEGVHSGCVHGAEERRQLVDVAGMHEDVASDVHLHAVVVGEGHRSGNFVQAEIRRPGPHAEPVGRQIYRIGPELHGGPQLLHTARRRQKLHMNSFVHASILRDSRPLHPKSAAIRPEGPGSKGSRQ